MDSQTQTQKRPVIMDISAAAYALAKIVDRLSPGTYSISVTKDPVKSIDWKVEINRAEFVQRVSLSRTYVSE